MGHNGIIASARLTMGGGSPPIDTQAPTIGTLNSPTLLCSTTFTISWTAATDNVGVTGYRLYKNGSLYQDVGDVLTYDVTGQTPSASSNWTVRAYDAALNESSDSNTRNITQTQQLYAITGGTGEASTPSEACGQALDTSYWISGNDTTPTNLEYIYFDECGTSPVNGGDQYWSNGSFSFRVSSIGQISNVSSC